MREESWRQAVTSYGPLIAVTPRYADVDVMQHLNNVAVGAMHLEARMRWMMACVAPDAWRSDGLVLRPGWLATDFLGEGRYPDPIELGVRCLGVDADGWDMGTAVFQHGNCLGTQQARMSAWCDGAQVPLPPALFATLQAAAQPLDSERESLPPELPSRPAPEDFAWSVSLQSRFSDMDADGLAGEVALSRCMETARILGVREAVPALTQALQSQGMGLVVGRVGMAVFDQRRPAPTWHAGVRVSRLGTASFTVQCALFAKETCVAVSETVLVSIHHASRRAMALPPQARGALAPLLAQVALT